MKKKFKTILISSLLLISLASCTGNSQTSSPQTITAQSFTSNDVSISTVTGEYNVTFDFGNGTKKTVSTNNHKISLTPYGTKIYSTLDGWYSDFYYKEKFDFNNLITSDITLYAKWNIDYPSLLNEIYKTTIRSNVKVVSHNYNMSFGQKINQNNSTGSGVIIKEDNNKYYLLTNNHVIYKSKDYQDITVTDSYETSYAVTVISQSADYDLALLSIVKGSKELSKVEIADYDTTINEELIALGNPKGLLNSISFGNLTSYQSVDTSEEERAYSNITFKCISHSAEINNGSSGGALLDTNLKLIGINFASTTKATSGEYITSLAIPSNKVLDFLRLSEFNL